MYSEGRINVIAGRLGCAGMVSLAGMVLIYHFLPGLSLCLPSAATQGGLRGWAGLFAHVENLPHFTHFHTTVILNAGVWLADKRGAGI